MFLHNTWYAAADSTELGTAPVGRVFLNVPVVLYRTPDGTPVALEDRCCHRRAPLSKGKVEGANLRCGYHGFLYDPTGKVVWVPGQDKLPPSSQVKSYPVAERHGYVWIWMGEASRADPARVPDFHWNSQPGWTSGGGYLHVRCNYLMLVDNLLDLSHVPFLHSATIGSANDTDPELDWERGPNVLRGVRVAKNLVAPKRLRDMGVGSNIDTRKVMHFTPPGNVNIEITQTVLDPGKGPPEYNYCIMDSMTPETETSCHYFWRNARNYDIGNTELTSFLCGATTRAFDEDKVMVEAAQRIIDLDPSAPQIDVNGDAGGLQARRIVDRLLAEECQREAAA
jgi:vanillate O-demethylase monooxygenase subunit